MKTKHLSQLILFGTFVLTGLMLIQIYWFNKAFDISEQQLDHRVQVALMRVADSVASGAEVKKLSSNFFQVDTQTSLDGQAIDSLVKSEFKRSELFLDYELGVYNAEDDTLVYGQYVEGTRKTRLEQAAANGYASAEAKNFAVYFPKKQSYVVAQLDIWIFSTIVLLMMMGFFTWAVVTLLRERRFAELKNDFINNMTHEFKTPVTNIGITAEILRKKLPDDAGLDVYLDILRKENEKLRDKIEKVLLGSTADLRKPSMEKVDVHELIRSCAESFELKIGEREGTLHLQLDAKSQHIMGDRDLLAQAINNVIDNAEKYSPTKPQISITTSDDGDAILIDIRDKGVGVPANLQSRVFEKFFRVSKGNVHNVKGFGLGLNFVRSVVQSHRGRVNLVSVVNEGTDIRIILPKA